MKVNRKKMLDTVPNNKSVVVGVLAFVVVFSMLIVPLVNKGTHSSDEDEVLILSCPETIIFGSSSIDCELILNSSNQVFGISGKYDESNTGEDNDDYIKFSSFSPSSDWSENAYYNETDGFVLVSDVGISGVDQVIGTITYNVSENVITDNSYSVILNDIQIGYEDSEEVVEEISAQIKIVSNDSSSEEEKSDINTLSSIKVNDGEIALSPSFSSDIYEYTATTDSETVIINVTKTDEKSMVSEDVSGEKSLNVGLNNFVITVTSESGNVKEYILKITRVEKVEDDNYSLSFDDSLNVDLEKKYIKNLSAGTTGTDLTNKVTVVSGNVKLYDVSGNEKDSDKSLASGDVLRIYSNNVLKEEYTISVVGDSNGDGVVDLIDLVQLRKHVAGWIDPKTGEVYSKTNVYYYSLDLNKDGVVDLIDVVRMRKINAGVI